MDHHSCERSAIDQWRRVHFEPGWQWKRGAVRHLDYLEDRPQSIHRHWIVDRRPDQLVDRYRVFGRTSRPAIPRQWSDGTLSIGYTDRTRLPRSTGLGLPGEWAHELGVPKRGGDAFVYDGTLRSGSDRLTKRADSSKRPGGHRG